jgi:arginyl-tRNA synthetase
MKEFYQQVTDLLADCVKQEWDIELTGPLWELPSRPEFGDLSSMVSMKLAGQLKQNPTVIAEKLKTILAEKLGDSIEKIEVLKPAFINIYLSRKNLLNSMAALIKEGDNFFRRDFKRKVLAEFVSANPTGPLSVAHGRQAIVGDMIVNILRFCGNEVTKEYYIND